MVDLDISSDFVYPARCQCLCSRQGAPRGIPHEIGSSVQVHVDITEVGSIQIHCYLDLVSIAAGEGFAPGRSALPTLCPAVHVQANVVSPSIAVEVGKARCLVEQSYAVPFETGRPLYGHSRRGKGGYTADTIVRIAPPRDLARDLVDVQDVTFAIAVPVREVGMLAVRLGPEDTLVRIPERRVLDVLEHNDVTIGPDPDVVICSSGLELGVKQAAGMEETTVSATIHIAVAGAVALQVLAATAIIPVGREHTIVHIVIKATAGRFCLGGLEFDDISAPRSVDSSKLDPVAINTVRPRRAICCNPGRFQPRPVIVGHASLVDPDSGSAIRKNVHDISLEVAIDIDEPDA